MDSNNTVEKQYIEDNKEYILGLYDLYNNDAEVEKMLVQKGLSRTQIQLILETTNAERKAKRLRQAKRFLILSLAVGVILWGIYLFFINLPGADTFDGRANQEEDFLYKYFIIYREAFYFVLFAVTIEVIFSIFYFVKRMREWRNFNRIR